MPSKEMHILGSMRLGPLAHWVASPPSATHPMRQGTPLKTRRSSWLGALAAVLSLLVLPAAAINFTLTSSGDTNAAAPATGSALDAGGQITLRSAMQAATQTTVTPGAHVITMPAGIGSTINPTIASQMPVGSATNNSITVSGPGKGLLTINQTQPNRIFSTATGARNDDTLCPDRTLALPRT